MPSNAQSSFHSPRRLTVHSCNDYQVAMATRIHVLVAVQTYRNPES
jgi:hypothetical protein